MTAMDLHPEDLLERDARGSLTPAERQRLELHLQQCAVCRIERLARADFRHESDGIAPEVEARRLIASLLAPRAPQEARRSAKRSRMRHFGPALVAATLVSAAGWAAAARWTGLRALVPWVEPPPPALAPPRAPVAHHAPPQPPEEVPPPAADTSEEKAAAPLSAPPAPSVPPRSVSRVQRVRAPSLVARPEPPVLTAPSLGPAPSSAPVPAPPPAEPDAPALFARANEARRAGDHALAARLYRGLIGRYPGSAEAHESLAVLGRVLLDDGDAQGALRSFDDYLLGPGVLREEVLLGRALALERLGRPDDEAVAWSALVAAAPGSVHAERARRRLLALGKQ